MGLWHWLRRRRSADDHAALHPVARIQIVELADQLRDGRGDNVRVSGSPGTAPPNRDGVKNLANAARDGRFIDRTNEDRVISDLREYRNLDGY